jgi:hypothetical protein
MLWGCVVLATAGRAQFVALAQRHSGGCIANGDSNVTSLDTSLTQNGAKSINGALSFDSSMPRWITALYHFVTVGLVHGDSPDQREMALNNPATVVLQKRQESCYYDGRYFAGYFLCPSTASKTHRS